MPFYQRTYSPEQLQFITTTLPFSYTADGSNGQFGNMTCVVNGETNGLCPQYTFNAANNRISGYNYDAAGDMTNDGVHAYTRAGADL
jgi:hypothetical protein